MPKNLDEPPIPRRLGIRHNKSIRRLFLGAHAPQSDLNHTNFLENPANLYAGGWSKKTS
jgi:hypothetical protein